MDQGERDRQGRDLPARSDELAAPPPDERRRFEHRSITWSGPLPPPEVLKEFGEAVPNADHVILGEFREQGAHRRAVEERESKATAFSIRATSLAASVLPFATLGVGVFLASFGEVWFGVAIVAGQMLLMARAKP